MRLYTQQLLQVLARGTFDSRWVCDVFYDGARKMQDVDLEDVKLTEDATAKVQQSGSLKIVYQGRDGVSIAPQGVEDILSPFGTTLALYMLITNGPRFEARVPMGVFVVSDTPTIETVPWSFRGKTLSKGDRIGLTFKDPFYKVLRNRFDVPGVTPSLASTYAEIQRLTRLTVTRSADVPDGPIPRALVYEEDRLDAVYELAKALDAIPYMRADGSLSLRPNVWGEPVDTISAANADQAPVVLTPEGRTAWTEQRRNRALNPRMVSTGLLYEVGVRWGWVASFPTTGGPDECPSYARLTVGAGTVGAGRGFDWYMNMDTVGMNTASGKAQPVVAGETLTVRAKVRASKAAPGNLRLRIHDGVSAWLMPTLTVPAVALPANEWVELSHTFTVPASGFLSVRAEVNATGWTSTDTWDQAALQVGDGGDYFDGTTNPGGGLQRTRWVTAANAGPSVVETREIIPATYAPQRPQRGTLVRVKRGMTAEGVYNRVVVRAQGQQAGVLAAGEITGGPLRASNADGADSPFGRVPYFLSSQLVTTPAQAEAEVAKWLPRVSRPQATVLDIEEIVNPLREVGDVVTIKRLGESFPARVVKVQRSSGRTQTTSVLVVPSA